MNKVLESRIEPYYGELSMVAGVVRRVLTLKRLGISKV